MRKALICAVLLAALPVFPQAPQPEPTTAELKAELAEARRDVAQLQQESSELQIRLQIAERAVLGPQLDVTRQQLQQRLQFATQAAASERAKADSEKKK